MSSIEASPSQPGPTPAGKVKKWLTFTLRWGIAIVGIWWVLSNISLRDRVLVLAPDKVPVEMTVTGGVPDRLRPGTQIQVVNPATDAEMTVTRADLVNPPDREFVVLRDGNVRLELLGLDLTDDRDTRVRRLLVRDPETREGRWVRPREVVDFQLHVPHPIVDRGLLPMVRNAQLSYLLIAVGIFPTVYFITAWRWHALLRALEIHIRWTRAFVLNMVGAFYSTFMPGSTGGDLLKAWYIAKHTQLRTRAVMSVIVDRALGLLALVIMGGAMAAIQYFRLPEDDPAKIKCAQIAFGAAVIIVGTIVALSVFYHTKLRRYSGLDFVLRKLPLQTQVRKAVETMEIYRHRPGLILWAIVVTLPVHATVVVSAMFAGLAFGLPLHPLYYWVVVPVVVLAGSIPISPQGAGVMEFFAILLTRRQGATISQAFALTMSIRLVQMFWNLCGGIFVLRGGYHAPTEKEAQEFEAATVGESAAPEAQATA